MGELSNDNLVEKRKELYLKLLKSKNRSYDNLVKIYRKYLARKKVKSYEKNRKEKEDVQL